MYEEYFGLERPPFKITPDTSLFYEGGKRGDILAALAYAIQRGEGIVKVVGEVGSGKTMLCRMLQLRLPDSVEIIYIANPSVSAEDILFVIAHELSLPVDKGASKHEVVHMLQDYLLRRHMENKQVVLFIEEAQGMPLETLEEVRLLSNLETDENKLLQILLFGQPELDQNLAQQSIRQLRERITHNFELEPLTRDEIHNYLNFRMREVGYTGPELISNTVAKKVEQHSEGLLRRINIIADKILLSAYAEGTHDLSPKHVTAAVNDSSFNREASRRSRLIWWLAPLLMLALAFALYQSRSQWMSLLPNGLLPAMQADAGGAIESAPVEAGAENRAAAVSVADAAPATSAADAAPGAGSGASDVDAATPIVAAGTAIASADAASVDQAVETPLVAAEPATPTSVDETSPAETVADSGTAQTEPVSVAAGSAETVTDADIDSLSAEVDTLVSQIEVAVQQAQASETLADTAAQAPGQADETAAVSEQTVAGAPADYQQWLDSKLEQSEQWLSRVGNDKMSIQVMMRNKSAARDLVYYLRNEWPLDISQTYLYEVVIEGRSIYRVFYSEYDSLSQARAQIETLPQSIKVNSPYVHSVYRMRQALL